jgi:hypothetical protein
MTRIQTTISLLCLFMAGSCLACKYRQVSLKESVSQAQSVFIAQAETASNGMSGRGPEIPASMHVTQVVKGSVKVGQRVHVHTSNSSCGLGIQAGQRWLILASGEPLRSDQPSGSILMTDPEAQKLVSDELGLKVDGF